MYLSKDTSCDICQPWFLFVVVLCLVYPMLPVSLDYPFLLAPSVFSNVYLGCLIDLWKGSNDIAT